MTHPMISSSEIIYRGYFNLQKDKITSADGSSHDYTSVRVERNAAVVIAKDVEGRLILNREFRYPTGEFILGLPGGSLDPEEEPLQGGQRELLEETGYWAEELQFIGCCYPIPSFFNQKIFFFYAINAFKKSEQKLDAIECIRTELKTETELYHEIQSGAAVDGVLCTALYYKSLAGY